MGTVYDSLRWEYAILQNPNVTPGGLTESVC